jgi:hypothetical protein
MRTSLVHHYLFILDHREYTAQIGSRRNASNLFPGDDRFVVYLTPTLLTVVSVVPLTHSRQMHFNQSYVWFHPYPSQSIIQANIPRYEIWVIKSVVKTNYK